MTTASYADRARRFLAEQSRVTEGGGDESDRSDESPPDRALSSLSSLSSPPQSGNPSPTPFGVEGDEREDRDQGGDAPTEAVWWDDGMPAGSASIFCLPPPPCIAPRACARLGPCARHVAGASCLRQP